MWVHREPLAPRFHTVLQDATDAAVTRGDPEVTTGHLLLSAIRERNLAWEAGGRRSTALDILDQLGADPEPIRDTTLAIMTGNAQWVPGSEPHLPKPDTPAVWDEILGRLGGIDQRLTRTQQTPTGASEPSKASSRNTSATPAKYNGSWGSAR